MILNNHYNKIIFWFVLSVVFVGFGFSVSAEVMTSNNYRIEKDSINTSGLDNAQSDNYKIKDTVGEVGTGIASSSSFLISSGYRQMDEIYISVTAPSTIAMSPSIGGVSGGTSDGSGSWNVKTDSSSGYYLSIKATSSPAMSFSGGSFADYTVQSGSTPDYDWNIGSGSSEFGFSVYNLNSQYSVYKNNGSQCSTGSSVSSGKCWDKFTTSYKTLVQNNSRTSIDGEDTIINFKAEVNGVVQVAGDYQAKIIVTVIPN